MLTMLWYLSSKPDFKPEYKRRTSKVVCMYDNTIEYFNSASFFYFYIKCELSGMHWTCFHSILNDV